MGRSIVTGNSAHDAACQAAEVVRQASILAGGSQAAANTAEIVYYRACLASAKARGLDQGPFIHALWSLGTGGA